MKVSALQVALVAYSVIRLHTRTAWQGVVLLTVLYLHRPAGNLFSWEPFLVTQLDLSGVGRQQRKYR